MNELDKSKEKEVQSIVVKELDLYRTLKVQLINAAERDLYDTPELYPGIQKNNTNDLKVKQMERALFDALDQDERMIIDMKYLLGEKEKDITIYMDLGMKKDTYYKLKRQATRKLAIALGII